MNKEREEIERKKLLLFQRIITLIESLYVQSLHLPLAEMHRKKIQLVIFLVFSIAIGAFLFHSVENNPQPDTQMVRYGEELFDAINNGQLGEYLMTVRKYPLLNSVLFIPIHQSLLTVDRIIHFLAPSLPLVSSWLYANLAGRMLVLLFAIGTLILIQRLSQLVSLGGSAPLLMLSSYLFFLFSTAARPHIPVMFWTLLSFYYSIHLSKKHNRKNIFMSFASATAAACTLQNGFLAFLFPLWGYFQSGKKRDNFFRGILLMIICLSIAFLFGYTFLLRITAGDSTGITYDLGHNYSQIWDGSGFLQLLRVLVGNEILLTLFAIAGIARVFRGIDAVFIGIVPIAGYLVIYCLLFGIYAGTSPRFFLMLVPFLALLGARAFENAPRAAQFAFLTIVFIMCAKFASLGMLQDSFQLVSSRLNLVRGLVYSEIPPYMFSIDARRLIFSTNDNALFRVQYYNEETPPEWVECESIYASPRLATGMYANFLWNEMDWGFFRLLNIYRLGPNLSLLCKRSLLEQIR